MRGATSCRGREARLTTAGDGDGDGDGDGEAIAADGLEPTVDAILGRLHATKSTSAGLHCSAQALGLDSRRGGAATKVANQTGKLIYSIIIRFSLCGWLLGTAERT